MSDASNNDMTVCSTCNDAGWVDGGLAGSMVCPDCRSMSNSAENLGQGGDEEQRRETEQLILKCMVNNITAEDLQKLIERSDTVVRLRFEVARLQGALEHTREQIMQLDRVSDKLLAERDNLHQDVARLRAVLEPFADITAFWTDDTPDERAVALASKDGKHSYQVTLAHARAARKELGR